MTSNSWRWIIALGLGFFAGAFTVIADSATFPGWYPLLRGGVVSMIPAVVALKMTLTPSASSLNQSGSMSGGQISPPPSSSGRK